MVSLSDIEVMLAKVGMYNKYWGRAEIRELCNILTDNEEIIGAVNGRYEGGWALLVATNKRLLLIDKKPWYLGLEDIRYDMIAEVDFRGALLDATISIQTLNKTLHFRSARQARLRTMTGFVQQHVMKMRQSAYEFWQDQNMPARKPETETLPLEMPRPAVQSQSARDFMVPNVMSITGTPLPRSSLMAKRRVRRFPLTENY